MQTQADFRAPPTLFPTPPKLGVWAPGGLDVGVQLARSLCHICSHRSKRSCRPRRWPRWPWGTSTITR